MAGITRRAVTVLLLFLGTVANAQEIGEPALLKVVADRLEANQKRLTTWRGEAVTKLSMNDDKGIVLARTAHTDFALDMAKGLQRTNWSATNNRERTEKGLLDFPDMSINHLTTKDRYYELSSDGYSTQGQTYPSLVVRPHESAADRAHLSQFALLRTSSPGPWPCRQRGRS